MAIHHSLRALAVFPVASAGALAQVPDFAPFDPATESAFAHHVRPLDVDLDGDVDLLLFHPRENSIVWLEATVPGQFAPPSVLVTLPSMPSRPAEPRDAALIDVAGSGSPDLVVALGTGDRLVRLPRTGAATFGAPTPIAASSSVRQLVAVDVDGDGDEDLVVAGDFASPGTWLVENVAGALSNVPVRIGDGGRLVEATDYDLDGDVDFFAVVQGNGLHVIRNDGPGLGFESSPLIGTVANADLAVGDTNNDGFPDAVVSGPNGGIRTFLGSASGAVTAGQVLLYGPTFPSAIPIELLDMDGDTDLDLVRANRFDADVEVIENVGSGFSNQRRVVPATSWSWYLTRGDLDGDALDDLITAGDSFVQVGLTAPTGVPQEITSTGRTWRASDDATTVDADADGDLDVVLVTDAGVLAISQNDGNGRLEFPAPVAGFSPPGALRPIGVTGADLDDDGRDDLVLEIRWGGLAFSRQLAGGTYGPPVLLHPAMEGPARIVDIDLDGDLDVVGTLASPDRVAVIPQTSPGVFGAALDLVTLSGRPMVVDFRDMDGDGVTDLVTHEDPVGLRSRAWVRYGIASGGFEAPAEVPLPTLGTESKSMLLEDFDGDGLLDLVYVQSVSVANEVRWTRNLGARTFDVPSTIASLDATVFSIAMAERFPGGPNVLAVNTALPGSSSASRYRLFDVTQANTLGASHQVDVFGSFQSKMLFAELGSALPDLVIADLVFDRFGVVENEAWPDAGTNYCGPAVPNSTGRAGALSAVGSVTVADNDLELVASGLPRGAATLFLASLDFGFVANPAGSDGNLCLGGAIGRVDQAGFVGPADGAGVFRRSLDLTAIPQPNGFVAVMPTSTWRFQAWHRDAFPGQAPTSNFTVGVEVRFL